jgi:CHAT domain-containing protein/Tfp pilus assembly protein PilF
VTALAFCLLLVASSAVPLLRPGEPIERGLARGEAHHYEVELAAGEYARLLLAHDRIDVVVAVSAPDGRPLAELDAPTDRSATDALSILAASGGRYGLEVRPVNDAEEAGRYRLWIEAVRPAGPGDRRRVEAEQAVAEAHRHFKLQRPEDLERALELNRKALPLWRELADPAAEALTLYRLGLTWLRHGDAREALSAFEQALALRRENGDRTGTIEALGQAGRAHRALGDPRRALAVFEEALALCHDVEVPEKEAMLLVNLGLLYQETGRPRDAVAAYERALPIYRQVGDAGREVIVLSNLGGVLAALGRPAEAFASFERSLAEAQRIGDRSSQANAHNNLGDLHNGLGQPRQALSHFLAALDLFREMGDAGRQAKVLNNLGDLLNNLGSPREARELLQQALPLHREKHPEAVTRINLSRSALELGDPQEALRLLEQALALERQVENPGGEMSALSTLGRVYADLGEAGKAAEHLEAALRLSRTLGDRSRDAVILRLLARARAALGSREPARTAFAEALRIAQDLGDVAEQARIFQGRARIRLDEGDLDGAREDLESALEGFESVRAEVSGERLRATYLASVHETYELTVEVLLRLHEAHPGKGFEAQAFAAAERSRARALLDFLARSEIEVREGDPELLAEEARLRLELAAKATRRMDLLREGRVEETAEEAAEAAAEAEKEIESLAVQHQLVESRLRGGDARYAALRTPETDLAAIQRLLDEKTLLLEYSLGETRSWLWVVAPTTLAVFELPGRERIEELARRVHEHLRTPNASADGDERADLAELSEVLLGPVHAGLEGKRLVFVTDGALRYIPFAALPVPAEGGSVPLIVRNEVVHLPSAAVLREIRRAAASRPRPAGDLAILADPVYESADPRVRSAAKRPAAGVQIAETKPDDPVRSLRGESRAEPLARLSWSRREAERIAAAAGGRDVLLALDFRASRELALSPALAGYRVLHFATHGFLDAGHPELSGLALSQWDEQGQRQDGFLRLQDIYGLDLHAGLVVLSGCETALGRRIRGEGFLGLTHGFLHAGASQVVASLWEVRDRSTAELMERFYRALYQDGLSPAAALRRAQTEMWEQRSWRDPYHWAAFVLQGDWSAPVP